MKVAITGATGFIGKLLTKKHIDAGDDVRILTRKNHADFVHHPQVELFKGDLSDANSLAGFTMGVDVLYHCAAEIKDESKMFAVNVTGTENLVKAAAGQIKHWVQLSSVGVYGPIFSGNVDETRECHPDNEYERTKLQSDKIVLAAGAKNEFTYTLIRPSNVFGPTMGNQSLFQLVKAIDKGHYFFIGKKGASANYVPVENVVEALYLASINPMAKNKIYNISDWMTLETFTEIISKELKKARPRLRLPYGMTAFLAKATAFVPHNPLTPARVRALNIRSKYLTDKIEKELSYKPVISALDALVAFTRHYKIHKN